MSYTAIGIFEHKQQVESALNQLALNHFESEDVFVSDKEEMKGRGDATDENGTLGSKAGVYFKNIFSDEKVAFQYAVVAQQATVIAVQTQTYEDAVRASNILDSCGAMNINDRARMLEDAMTRDERLHSTGPELRVYPGLREYDKDATPSQLENERRASAARRASSIVERPAGSTTQPRDYIDEPDSAYVNPSKEERKER